MDISEQWDVSDAKKKLNKLTTEQGEANENL